MWGGGGERRGDCTDFPLNAPSITIRIARFITLRERQIAARNHSFFKGNRPFAAGGHMVRTGGQAAHWDIQNKENSNLS